MATPWRQPLAAAIVILALLHYVVVVLPFQTSLRVNAALVLAIVAAVALTAARGPLAAFRGLPGQLRLGLILYATAACWGALVGALSGHSVSRIAGQSVAMLLLPAGALAFAGHRRFRGELVVGGLAAAAVVALMLHVAIVALPPAVTAAVRSAGGGLRFRYGVTFAGFGVVAALCCMAWLTARRSKLAMAGATAAMVMVVWSLSRGAWLAVTAGALVLVPFAIRGRRSLRRLALAVGAIALALAAGLAVAAASIHESARFDFEHGEAPRSKLAAIAPEGHSGSHSLQVDVTRDHGGVTIADVPLAHPGGVVVSWWIKGPPAGAATLWIEVSDASGARLIHLGTPVRDIGEWTNRFVAVRWPRQGESLSAGLYAGEGRWLVDDHVVWPAPSRWVMPLLTIGRRVAGLTHVVRDPGADPTMAYRFAETRAVLERWSQASVLRVLVGQGLGAEFPFGNSVWTDTGGVRQATSANYIHNFYLFLGFKLGVAGVAALAGLVLIAALPWRLARRRPPARQSWIHAAATAVWVAYFIWGVTSPEVIDFRVAPVLGALAVASCGDQAEEEETVDPAPASR